MRLWLVIVSAFSLSVCMGCFAVRENGTHLPMLEVIVVAIDTKGDVRMGPSCCPVDSFTPGVTQGVGRSESQVGAYPGLVEYSRVMSLSITSTGGGRLAVECDWVLKGQTIKASGVLDCRDGSVCVVKLAAADECAVFLVVACCEIKASEKLGFFPKKE